MKHSSSPTCPLFSLCILKLLPSAEVSWEVSWQQVARRSFPQTESRVVMRMDQFQQPFPPTCDLKESNHSSPQHSVASHGFASKISLVKKRPYSSMPFSASSWLRSRVQKHVSPSNIKWYSSSMLAGWKKCQSSPNTSASSFFWTTPMSSSFSVCTFAKVFTSSLFSCFFWHFFSLGATFKTQQWLVWVRKIISKTCGLEPYPDSPPRFCQCFVSRQHEFKTSAKLKRPLVTKCLFLPF